LAKTEEDCPTILSADLVSGRMSSPPPASPSGRWSASSGRGSFWRDF